MKLHIIRSISWLFITIVSVTLSTSCLAYDLENMVQSYTLDNGLKVLIVERHFSPTVAFYIRYNVGAVNESSNYTGTAHFLEHMLFKGTQTIGTTNYREEAKILKKIHNVIETLDTEKMKGENADLQKVDVYTRELAQLRKRADTFVIENEIDRLYTENGGADLNASTGYDLTSYHVSLPSNKIELWARIESDRMNNPVFRSFFSERNVVIEERRQTVESKPPRKLMEQFLATAFTLHPYRRPILGWKSEMPFLNLTYMRHFFKIYHSPNNTVIAVVGDVSPPDVMKIIIRYFGGIAPQEIPPSHIPVEPPQQGERRIELVADSNPEIMIGYHKPTLPSSDDYAFDIIDIILSKGRTSRLYTKLINVEELAASITTINGFPASRYPNLFLLHAAPRYPHTAKEVEQSIYEEIERLKREAVSARELKKAKTQLKADFIRGLKSNSGLASMLSYFEAIAGDYHYITDHIKTVEKITTADIMEVAKKYLIAENRTVAILVQKQ